MNKVFLIGNVAKIETKDFEKGKATNYTLAISRKYKNANGEYESDFINCVAFNKTAELMESYVKKGDKLAIEGTIRVRSYEKDGKKVYITEILTEKAEFLSQKSKPEEIKTEEIKEEKSNSDNIFEEFGKQIEINDEDVAF